MKLKEMYNYGRHTLAHESLILCEELYGYTRQDIILNPDIEIENSDLFIDAVKRRKEGEPLQYILGYWYFDEIKLKVCDGVLIPREDSLCLVDIAEKFVGNSSYRGADLCSGTGAIALALSKRCENAKIDAIELFPVPMSCLLENCKDNKNVHVKNLDVFTSENLYEELDFIVSNPPYIETEEIQTLDIEVRNEPHTALDGGKDGLDFYRHICKNWSKCLRKSGLLAVEIGETQGEEVSDLFRQSGFSQIEVTKDFNGHDRVVSGIK